MDDLQHYRVRIGQFYNQGRHPRSRRSHRSRKRPTCSTKKSSRSDGPNLFSLLVLLLATVWKVVGLAKLARHRFRNFFRAIRKNGVKSSLLTAKCRLQSSFCGKKSLVRNGTKFSLLVLFLAGTFFVCIIIALDPRVEWNPGPSMGEDSLVKAVKEHDRNIARMASHRFFLASCCSLKIIPRGLDLQVPLAAAKSNAKLETDIRSISTKNSVEVMQRMIVHYNESISLERKRRATVLQKLKLCVDRGRFLLLEDSLKAAYECYLESQRSVKLKKIDNYLKVQDPQEPHPWLPDLALTTLERDVIINNENLCDEVVNGMMKLLTRTNPLISTQSTCVPTDQLHYAPCETVHIHHDGHGHFLTSTSIGGIVKLYDSLNKKPTEKLVEQLTALYSPDSSPPPIRQVTIVHSQSGIVDCGIFALAYAIDLFHGVDPSTVFYDQSCMREHLLYCLNNRLVVRFPLRNQYLVSGSSTDVTQDVPVTKKWSTPKETIKHTARVEIEPIQLSNRFQPLVDLDESERTERTEVSMNAASLPQSRRSRESGESILDTEMDMQSTSLQNEPTTLVSNNAARDISEETELAETATAITSSEHLTQIPPTNQSKMVRNLTHNPYRPLTKDEIEVLELGLTFSPSRKFLSKETLAENLFAFFRKMKLSDYFHRPDEDNNEVIDAEQGCSNTQDWRDNKWQDKNSEWYPKFVRNNRSPALVDFIKDTLKDIKDSISSANKRDFNNLSDNKRKVLDNLSRDPTIVIKRSDKCGSIVIMNTEDYERACLELLEDRNNYEEVEQDPNESYAENLRNELSALKARGLLTERQYGSLTPSWQTPAFYALPKMHKTFFNFPAMRPICSGSSSPTVKISQFVDSFLKPIAERMKSYVRDTSHFLSRIKDVNLPVPSDTFLVTMDVTSLYPNIDHAEGTSACYSYLQQHDSDWIPAHVVQKLITLILRCNTMVFKNRFFHQIRGTAMGTGMAVNYANLFMASFEEDMLEEYFKKTGLRPSTWLRFIDDIFFVWQGSEETLKDFLSFCNNFSEQRKMSSRIKFTHTYSTSSVIFLDTIISISQEGSLISDLYCKPTAAYQYLHQTSYHHPHLIKSIPKSQFIRIRRICSTADLYWKHAREFIKHFSKRGYNLARLQQTAADIASQPREDLFLPKENSQKNRVTLVLSYHHHFRDLAKILHANYRNMISKCPRMKDIFPEPPMIAFRRTKNLGDKLIRARHWKKPNEGTPSTNRNDTTTIRHLMNNEQTLHNKKNGRTCTIAGGNSTDKHVVYAVECLKHEILYVGKTINQVNQRMNGHRSDITHYPNRCELTKHFHDESCDFDNGIKISILEHVKGHGNKLLRQEDKWILRLGTKQPTGLNDQLSEFGSILKCLSN